MTEEPRVVSQSQLHTQLEDVLRKVLLCARLREHPFLRLWKERKPDVPLDKIHLYCSEALRPMAVITDIATAAKDAWLEVYRTGMKFEDESKVVDLCCHMSLVAFARTIEQKRAGWPGISGIPSINVVAIEAAAIMAAVWLDTGLTLRIDASGKGKRIVVSNLIYDLAEIQFGVKGIEAAIEDEIHAFARKFLYGSSGESERLLPELVREVFERIGKQSGAMPLIGIKGSHLQLGQDSAGQLAERYGVKIFIFAGQHADLPEQVKTELQQLERTMVRHFTEILSVASGKPRVKVFISYSHKDDKKREFIAGHLRVLMSDELIELWDDHQISAGDEWKSAIDMQLDTCRIAVLLLSKDFIGSKFISNVEVPRLLERHAGRGMRIVPVLYDDFAFKHVPWLARLQLRPRDGKALAKFRPADRDTQMRLIAEEIATLCKA